MNNLNDDIKICIDDGIVSVVEIEKKLENRKYFSGLKTREKRKLIKEELNLIYNELNHIKEGKEFLRKNYLKNKVLLDKFGKTLTPIMGLLKPLLVTIIIIPILFGIISFSFDTLTSFSILYYIYLLGFAVYLSRHEIPEIIYKLVVVFFIYSFLKGIKEKLIYFIDKSDIIISNQYLLPEPFLLCLTVSICIIFFSKQLLYYSMLILNPLFYRLFFSFGFCLLLNALLNRGVFFYYFQATKSQKDELKAQEKIMKELYEDVEERSKMLRGVFARYKANLNHVMNKAKNIVLISEKIVIFFTGKELKNDIKQKKPSLFASIVMVTFSLAITVVLSYTTLFKYTIYLDNKQECKNQLVNKFIHIGNDKILYLSRDGDNVKLISDDCITDKVKVNYELKGTEKEKFKP